MPRPKALPTNEIEAALTSLPGWTLTNGKLHRELRFPDFVAAFGFMTQAALHAEKLDHHPEWSNVYAKVVVDLVTHDAKGITELDLELARRMNAIVAAMGAADSRAAGTTRATDGTATTHAPKGKG